MPAIGNLTTKKWDGTTVITLDAIQPSAGENPAVYAASALGSSKAFRPTLTYSHRRSGTGTAVRGQVKFTYPQTVSDLTTGLEKVVNTALFEVNAVIPATMPESVVKDALAILASALLPAAGTLSLAVATGTGVV